MIERPDVPVEFNRVAKWYDTLTTMNPGYRRHLRKSATRMRVAPDGRLLDLCCGTGLSTEALKYAYPQAEIDALDGSKEMLSKARGKPELSSVRFLLGDAMAVAEAGAEGPYDGILMAYGIRNMPDIDACLTQLYGLLSPGGQICFHEYSVADSRWGQMVWRAVTRAVIIPSGWLTSPRSDIYRYLKQSVLDFDGVSAFEARLRRLGFVGVSTEPMGGWQRGIVHSFLASRPLVASDEK